MTIDERIFSAYDEPPAVLVAPCDGNPWVVTRPVADGAAGVLTRHNHGSRLAELGLECGPVVDYLEFLERDGLASALSGGRGEGGAGKEDCDHGGSVA